jgi:ribosome modulation factor
MSAYDLGYQAGRSGRSWFDCPYSSMHRQFDYKAWMRGHADGMRDRRLPAYYDEY